MRKEGLEFLDRALEFYVHDGLDGVYDLYKDYSAYALETPSDLKDSVIEFCNFLNNNLYRIKRKYGCSDESILRAVASFKRSILFTMDRYMSEPYQNFANLVYELSPSKSKEKVFEVGAGKIPSSSIYLADRVDQIKTIDSEFYISKVGLQNLGVDSEERFFNSSSKIDGYSFVVGRCPCSAIKYMVEKCAQANIPYLIKLCDCELIVRKRNSGVKPTWGSVLLQADADVKIYKNFAYNLDVSEEMLDKLIERYDMNPTKKLKNLIVDSSFFEKIKFVEDEEPSA